jgi:hypothetical protein
MTIWLRTSRFSVSSRARHKVRAGLAGLSRGRRRTRPPSGGRGRVLLGVAMGVAIVVALVVRSWAAAIPILAIALIVAARTAKNNSDRKAGAAHLRARQEAANAWARGEAEQKDAQRRAEAQQRWLERPPPPLRTPKRFTEKWFAANVPKLHPGQIPVLVAELRTRGWTSRRIEQRIGRHLAANPFYTRDAIPAPAERADKAPHPGVQV